MTPFEYHCPASVADATELLARFRGTARPLAGGTDLLVKLRLGSLCVEHVIDIKRIPETTRIAFDPQRGLTIGAAASCAELCESRDARRLYPGLVDAAELIGGVAIQGRATLGGNLCNAAPSADCAPALIVLGAECEIARAGTAKPRALPVAAFCTAPGRTALAAGELLVAIHLPLPQRHSGAAYLRFIPRGEMDIAVAGAGVWLLLNKGRIAGARVALAAVAPTPLLVPEAGSALLGREPGGAAFAEAGRIAAQAARPITDVRGTAAQRSHLVAVLVERALARAAERASVARR